MSVKDELAKRIAEAVDRLLVTHLSPHEYLSRMPSNQEVAAAIAGCLAHEEESDQPCPDSRCNDHFGAMPIPQCVTAVKWAEDSQSLQVVAEAARDFVWEPENWEAYQDSKDSDSVAWPPEFLLMAQAVEKKYGPMPVEEEATAT
jgi:hypothetical protein